MREEWDALANTAENVFATYEWAAAWWANLSADASLLLAACRRDDGSIAGILPLVVSRERRLRVVRLLGHGPADRLAPLCAPDDRPAVATALRRFLSRTRVGDLFLGEQMPAEEGWGPLLGATTVSHEPSPALNIAGLSWDEFLARRSSNFRQQVRRRERLLAKRGSVRFRLIESESDLEAGLNTLFKLHHAGWQREGSSAFSGARVEMFHREFAAAALARGWLRLWILELDDRPLAAWYGFRYGGAEWYYQSGRDPDADADSVGFVLLCHTIRESMNDGMREYRMLRGGEAYKGRFADRDPGLESIAFGLTSRGRAALLQRRARPVVGRALRRLRSPVGIGREADPT